MTEDKLRLINTLIAAIPELTIGQLHWIQRVVEVFAAEHYYTVDQSNLFDIDVMRNFGDALRIHHGFSAEPFSKDKFEYVLAEVLKLSGRNAVLAPKGNPGHDITVEDVRISLKTQADKNIKQDKIWVSKFMELGKGQWGSDPGDLVGLRRQFLNHLENYDRILSLRALKKAPNWNYELVEIPIELLKSVQSGRLEMKLESPQNPKPGYCHVLGYDGRKLFELYFDGGTERKLQIRNLTKQACVVHATWQFIIP